MPTPVFLALAALREAAGVSTIQLAPRIDISQSLLWQAEEFQRAPVPDAGLSARIAAAAEWLAVRARERRERSPRANLAAPPGTRDLCDPSRVGSRLRRDRAFLELAAPLRDALAPEGDNGQLTLKRAVLILPILDSLFRPAGEEWAVVCPPNDTMAYFIRYAWARKWRAGRLRTFARGSSARNVTYTPSDEPGVAGYVRGDREQALLLDRGEAFVLMLLYLALEHVDLRYDPRGREIEFFCAYPLRLTLSDNYT